MAEVRRRSVISRFFRPPVHDVMACLERLVAGCSERQAKKALLVTVAALAVTWFIYVPIHELLHAAGCVVTGGEVSRLEISPRYGGTLLSRWFPFVVSGSDYAGQLTGFDTRGSDAIYLATDFGPFVLSVIMGVPLIKLCKRYRNPMLCGVAVVVGLAPFYNFPGDYYEMGSIITTRAVTVLGGGEPATPSEDAKRPAGADADSEPTIAYKALRADDIFRLVGRVMDEPHELGLDSAGRMAFGTAIIAVGMVLSILLAFATYWCGHVFSIYVLRLQDS